MRPPAPSRYLPQLRKRQRFWVASGAVNVSVVRLPQVNDLLKEGLVTYTIGLARERGVSANVGDGSTVGPPHVLETARLYRLAPEKRELGAKYHAFAEEGVQLWDIAESIGRSLKMSISPRRRPAISDGSRCSPVATFRLRGRKRRNGWMAPDQVRNHL